MIRFILAFIGGTVITLALLLVGISLFDDPPSKASLRKGVTVEPLPDHASVDVAEWLEELHEALAYGLLAFIGVHVAAALVESVHYGENLVAAMVHGRKRALDSDGGLPPG